jgi:hypothetical protein
MLIIQNYKLSFLKPLNLLDLKGVGITGKNKRKRHRQQQKRVEMLLK